MKYRVRGSRSGKYNAVKVKRDGHTFDSKAEAKRYGELKLLAKAGHIQNLIVHSRWQLKVQGSVICFYEADFEYIENNRVILEDVKGVATAVFKLKAKLFKALYPGIQLKVLKI